MRFRHRPWWALPLVLLGCGAGSAEDGATDFDPVTDVLGLMTTVVEPAAETYWDAVGWIVDADGERFIRPETPEEWEAVLHSAHVIAESGNLLMMDGRALDRGAWMGFSRDLVDVGRRAIAAAEARDPQGVFDAGAEVYFVCSDCHATYALQTLRPNDERTDSTEVARPDRAGDEPDGVGDQPDSTGAGN